MAKNFDVLIVGGGIVGCGLAYELSNKGMAVAVVERGATGGATSAVNQGGIRQQFHHPINIQAGLQSLKIISTFEECFGINPRFQKNGYLFALSTPTSDQFFSEAVRRQNLAGGTTVRLKPDDVAKLFPAVRTDDLLSATYSPDDGYLEPKRLVRGFAQTAKRLGARFFAGETVKAFKTNGSKIEEIRTDRDRYSAANVINAAGPWAAKIAQLYGHQLPISPHRSSIFILGRQPASYARMPLVIDIDRRVTMRPYRHGIMTGSAHKPEVRRPVWPSKCDWSLAEDTFARLTFRVPGLSVRKIQNGWSGYWEVTPDDNPIIGWTHLDNVYTAAGFSGHGMSIAPGLLSSISADFCGESPHINLDLFQPDRFESGPANPVEIWGGTGLAKIEKPRLVN